MLNCERYGIESYRGADDMVRGDRASIQINFNTFEDLSKFEDWMRRSIDD